MCREEKEGGSLNKKQTGRAVRGETERKLCLALNVRVLMFYQ